MEYEAGVARAVYAAGVPSPAPGEIIEAEGRRGLLHERRDDVSMLQDMNTRLWTFLRQARSLAELQVQINRQSISGLLAYKDRLNYDICNATQRGESLRKKAFSMARTCVMVTFIRETC